VFRSLGSCAFATSQKDLDGPGRKLETEAPMSPIFNASALQGLSNNALLRLRAALVVALSYKHLLTDNDRKLFWIVLQTVEAILRTRSAPMPPAPRPGF
jgi:hypothetical protein